MSREAKQGDHVAVHYTGRLQDGTVFDSSDGREPIKFDVGGGEVIAGFDRAVTGMKVGETREVTIPAAEAYGEVRPELRLRVPRSELPEGHVPEVGQMFAVQVGPDQQATARMAEVHEDTVVLDLNHPLAGEPLTFGIELVRIDE